VTPGDDSLAMRASIADDNRLLNRLSALFSSVWMRIADAFASAETMLPAITRLPRASRRICSRSAAEIGMDGGTSGSVERVSPSPLMF
jgi:hypothetical protein